MRTSAYALALVLLVALVFRLPATAQTPAIPTITSISPDSVVAGQYALGSTPLVVTIVGKGFNARTTARLADGEPLTVSVDVTGTLAKVALPVTLLQKPLKRTIILTNEPLAISTSIGFAIVAPAAGVKPSSVVAAAPPPVATLAPTPTPTIAPTPKPTPTPTLPPCPPGSGSTGSGGAGLGLVQSGPGGPSLSLGVSNPGTGPTNCIPVTTIQVTNGVPVLSSIAPTNTTSNSFGLSLTLSGANFNSTSTIVFGRLTISPSGGTANLLGANIPPSALINPGVVQVFVTNPAPGGGTSQPIAFFITAPPNPIPSITGVSPSSINAGGSATSITVTGTGFSSSTAATLGGVAGTVSGNAITFNLPAAQLANPGSLSGLITNPLPGGGASSFTVNVLNPTPTVNGFSPTSANAGAPATSIQVSGTNFRNGSTITFAGTAVPTTFVSATTLSGTLSASFLQGSGNFTIGVTNPGLGGAPATAATMFTISNALPVLTNVTPAQIPIATVAATVTLTGTGFAANSSASAGATSLATQYVSATSLSVTIPPALMLSAGTLSITVSTPAPGGGKSPAVGLAIGNPIPLLAGVTPAALTSSQANSELILAGTNFVPGAVVALGAVNLTTTVVSRTQVTAILPSPIPLGIQPVTVTNPAPGGGASNALTIQITASLPTIVGVTPASAGPGQLVTVTGTNFGPGTVFSFNGTQIATNVLSATQLTVTIPATAAAGSASIVVQNPSTSTTAVQNSAAFTIQILGSGSLTTAPANSP
jgi:hypothetical protein